MWDRKENIRDKSDNSDIKDTMCVRQRPVDKSYNTIKKKIK